LERRNFLFAVYLKYFQKSVYLFIIVPQGKNSFFHVHGHQDTNMIVWLSAINLGFLNTQQGLYHFLFHPLNRRLLTPSYPKERNFSIYYLHSFRNPKIGIFSAAINSDPWRKYTRSHYCIYQLIYTAGKAVANNGAIVSPLPHTSGTY
jgi:hypothetical protein